MTSDSLASTSTAAPIPTKRPKVLSKKYCPTIVSSGSDQCDSTDSKIETNLASIGQSIILAETSSMPASINQVPTTSALQSDLPNKQSFGESSTSQPAYNVDAEKPGCSYHIQPPTTSFNNFEMKKPTAPLKPGTFMRRSRSVAQMLYKQPPTATKHTATKMKRSAYTGAGTNAARMKGTLRRANISPEGRKRKKKSVLPVF